MNIEMPDFLTEMSTQMNSQDNMATDRRLMQAVLDDMMTLKKTLEDIKYQNLLDDFMYYRRNR
jgi:hypothetical protein